MIPLRFLFRACAADFPELELFTLDAFGDRFAARTKPFADGGAYDRICASK